MIDACCILKDASAVSRESEICGYDFGVWVGGFKGLLGGGTVDYEAEMFP